LQALSVWVEVTQSVDDKVARSVAAKAEDKRSRQGLHFEEPLLIEKYFSFLADRSHISVTVFCTYFEFKRTHWRWRHSTAIYHTKNFTLFRWDGNIYITLWPIQ